MNTPAETPATVPNDSWYRLTDEVGGGGNVFALSSSPWLSLALGDAGREPGGVVVAAGGTVKPSITNNRQQCLLAFAEDGTCKYRSEKT
jgi:hypothetical protein